MTNKTEEDRLSQASSLLDPFTVVRGLTLGKLAERVCLAWQISRTNCFCVFLWLMVFAYSLSITCHVLVCLWDGVVCKTRAERERERERDSRERARALEALGKARYGAWWCMQPPFSILFCYFGPSISLGLPKCTVTAPSRTIVSRRREPGTSMEAKICKRMVQVDA